MKTAAVLSFSEQGAQTAQRVSQALQSEYDIALYAPRGNLSALTAELFGRVDALIFVGACGIAVRAIAPHVAAKTTDPAVLVLDERANHVISLLSGHIGGANALCWRLAAALESDAVITTATDVNHRFSVDAWAARQGLVISDMKIAKLYSSAILKRDLPLYTDLPIEGELPSGVYYGDTGAIGAAVSYKNVAPFNNTLHLTPPVLYLGIGCKRDTPEERIASLVEQVFSEHQLAFPAVAGIASIDVKSNEAGLLSFAAGRNVPISFYNAEELRAAPGEFTASSFVAGTVGVDNVCERSAILAAGEGARLLVKKTSQNGVTVAVALGNRRICFE